MLELLLALLSLAMIVILWPIVWRLAVAAVFLLVAGLLLVI